MAYLLDDTAKAYDNDAHGKSRFSRPLMPIERLSALIEFRTISIRTETPAIIFDKQKSNRKADRIQSTSITSVA
jgi:hypothetical protein